MDKLFDDYLTSSDPSPASATGDGILRIACFAIYFFLARHFFFFLFHLQPAALLHFRFLVFVAQS